jgi:hypothetical protein
MICPVCKEEYRDGFTACADCGAKLVSTLPFETIPDSAPAIDLNTLVPVLETHNQADIAVIKSMLDAAGIIYHFSGESLHMMGVRPLPARLLVASDRQKEVRALLKKLDFFA